ncbi:MAG: DUF2177 family protein [Rhodoplanes sp.]
MATAIAAYLSTLVVFVLVDFVWLSAMAARLYRPILDDILAPSVNFLPAVGFYLMYPLGIVVFAILPALKSGGLSSALIYGAMFGFFTYATYDLTNHATLRNWTWQITILDIAWGSFIAAMAAVVGSWMALKIGGTH